MQNSILFQVDSHDFGFLFFGNYDGFIETITLEESGDIFQNFKRFNLNLIRHFSYFLVI